MQNAGSLVKYHTPILVNTTGTKNIKKGTKKVGNADKQTTQTEDILNSILPPRLVLIKHFKQTSERHFHISCPMIADSNHRG